VKNSRYSLYEGDIRDKRVLEKIQREQRAISVVFHLAAMAGVRNSLIEPGEYVDVDIGGTVNLLEFSRWLQVEKFVFASSSSVYGKNPKTPFSEEDALEGQVSPYAAAKRAAEIFCQTYSQIFGISSVVLRFFTVYGPRQRPEMAIHYFTKSILEGKPFHVFGDGKSSRDYTYIDDIVFGIIQAIDYSQTKFEVFNLGNSHTVTLSEMIQMIERETGKKAEITRMDKQMGDVSHTWADIRKAERWLSYFPKTDLEEGIGKFVKWFRERNGAD